MGFPTRFIVEQLQVSLLSDSFASAHPLTNPDVSDKDSVRAHFSTITYAKEDLFRNLDANAGNSLASYEGMTISRYFKSWSEKAGHPLLTVNIDHASGRMTVGQVSFYRVNYDQATWTLITQALRSNNRAVIHEYNRAQDIIFASSTAVVQRLGFIEGTNGNFMDDLLRMHVMTFLCNAGHEQCSNVATQRFQAWRQNGDRIPPNMRPWVYCGGLRNGNEADFDFFWRRYLDENLSNEKVVMLGAAGCTGNTVALHKFLDVIVSTPSINEDEDIRPQDYSAAISSAVTSNEANTMKVIEWLMNHPQHLDTANGISLLSTATSRLLTQSDILRVETWLNTATQLKAEAIQAARAGIATSTANIQWYQRRQHEFKAYFDTGYFEEGFEVPPSSSTTTEATPSTPEDTPSTPEDTPSTPGDTTSDATITDEPGPSSTEPTTTAEPGSANIASLSFFTLIITVIINMV
ncbi:hypothetical protein HF086_012884 [Spodoptera exigua]|uniref:ERAP1-like C-terminal domain-containing protein n=1 Tax=Spodoptera exigua TaxID=7107 RepID=A0A922MVH0_SPOEX|nr:hypothetical protein HF086_012884 [Spodoptera exigua]